MKSLLADDFLNTSACGVIIDVRTPAEYAKGHIPSSINIPIFSDEERVIVGTLYKRVSKEAAVEKGLELVGPKLAEFVRTAKRASKGRPLFLYCWRGGMRSGSMAWLFETAGLEVKVLAGGYKAYRRSFDRLVETFAGGIVILAGSTGSGKTEILNNMEQMGEQVVDLEALAHHKGSVFGGLGQKMQPTTEHYQNLIHEKIRKFTTNKTIWCEGESMSVGKIFIPKLFFDIMGRSKLINFVLPLDIRVKRLVKEYGDFNKEELIEAFEKIRKRLGPVQTTTAIRCIENGDIAQAAEIALYYYDKSYKQSTAARESTEVMTIESSTNDQRENAKRIIDIINSSNGLSNDEKQI